MKQRNALAIAVGLVVMVGIGGCRRGDGYSQETPDAVIKTAKLMVERGDAARLHELLYAENDDMRALFKRVGKTLGHLQELGRELNGTFPLEIAKLKAQTEDAAKKGQATGLLQQFANQSGFGGRGRAKATKDQQKEREELLSAAIKRLFADPYGFLEENSGKLTTAEVSDDVVAVMWDKAMIVPPVGLTMKRTTFEGAPRWSLVLPLNLPFLASYVPRTPDEYKVLGSLVKTIDNVIIDLTKDVKSRKVTSLDQVSKKAGEKLFLPAAMTVFAYSKVVDARKKAAAPAARAPK